MFRFFRRTNSKALESRPFLALSVLDVAVVAVEVEIRPIFGSFLLHFGKEILLVPVVPEEEEDRHNFDLNSVALTRKI
jgi:hypothetical protein